MDNFLFAPLTRGRARTGFNWSTGGPKARNGPWFIDREGGAIYFYYLSCFWCFSDGTFLWHVGIKIVLVRVLNSFTGVSWFKWLWKWTGPLKGICMTEALFVTVNWHRMKRLNTGESDSWTAFKIDAHKPPLAK